MYGASILASGHSAVFACSGLPKHKCLEDGNKLLLPKLYPPPKHLDRTASEVAGMHRLNLTYWDQHHSGRGSSGGPPAGVVLIQIKLERLMLSHLHDLKRNSRSTTLTSYPGVTRLLQQLEYDCEVREQLQHTMFGHFDSGRSL